MSPNNDNDKNKPIIDDVTGVETTGHEWDGIRELDNPMPRWWLWSYYGTVVWSLVYVIVFPALPFIEDYSRGLFDYSSRKQVTQEVAQGQAAYADLRELIAEGDIESIRSDDKLFTYAIGGGRSAYLLHCSQCHGSGADGGQGYPNLNDDDWLWGGDLQAIEQTIRYGIRAEDEATRISQMPAFLDDGILNPSQLDSVTHYVLSLSATNYEEASAPAISHRR